MTKRTRQEHVSGNGIESGVDTAVMKHWTKRKGIDVWQENLETYKITKSVEGVEKSESNVRMTAVVSKDRGCESWMERV